MVLEYVKRPSSLKENAPLVLMLHGYGSDENDLFSFASELPAELFIISAKAPLQLMPYGNAWYSIYFDAPQGKWSDTEEAIKSRDLIATFIDEVVAAYPIDSQNITLLGFSQGTILSYAVALTYPQKVKNVVALSGYINTDLLPDPLPSQDYGHLDFYCSHGSVDQVIPVDWARKSIPMLEQLNVKHHYSEFPVGHGVAPQNFFEMKAWLEKRI